MPSDPLDCSDLMKNLHAMPNNLRQEARQWAFKRSFVRLRDMLDSVAEWMMPSGSFSQIDSLGDDLAAVHKDLSTVMKFQMPQASKPIYRGITIEEDSDIAKKKKGSVFKLKSKNKYSSWSYTLDTPEYFIEGGDGVILQLIKPIGTPKVWLVPQKYMEEWFRVLLGIRSPDAQNLRGEEEYVLQMPTAKVKVIKNTLFK